MSFIDIKVGSRLRRERKAIGRSLAQQALAVGLSEDRLEALEAGNERVSAIELKRFCDTLGLRPGDVYSDVIEPFAPRVAQAPARTV